MIQRILLPFMVVLALVSTAAAQHFLPDDCNDLITMIPAWPPDDSPAGRADLDTVLEVQANRTPEQIQRAKRVASQTLTSFAHPVFGDWFDTTNACPRTKAIFDIIDRESSKIVEKAKATSNRPRPYIRSAEVNPAVGRPTNTSYPSGHSASAAVWGTILAAAFPDKAVEFRKQIHETMWCRVIGGVHYPSDIEAGDMLGEAIANKMLQSPDMQAALQTIREEITPHLHSESTAAAPAEPATK